MSINNIKRKNTKYNLENLINYSEENNFKLLKEYDESTICIETIIEGTCATKGCENNFSKNYKRLITISGPYCKFCQNGRVVYDNNSLNLFIEKNNIILLKDYSDIKVCRDTKIEGKCLMNNCLNTFNKNYRYLVEEGGGYCDDCVMDNRKAKLEETNIKKYGVNYYTQKDDWKDEYLKILDDKYGVKSSIEIIGVKEKIIDTNLKKFGCEYSSQNNEIRQKVTNTNLKKFGVNCVLKNENIKKNIIDTNLKKYGVKYPQQNKTILNKSKQTNIKKYGVEHVSQNPIIAEKQLNNSFLIKDYKFPSGTIIKCQGYEPFALDKLIKDGTKEDDIITSRINVPEIWYIKESDNKKSRHYVDIFIPSQKFCIEVKSTWTFSRKNEDILAKQKAGKELGYKYEIWIFDSKGNIINQIK